MITDNPASFGFDRYFGIWVVSLGEDADMMAALGHHDGRHALAAFNACARNLLGWTDLYDGLGRLDPDRWKKALDSLEATWAVQKHACDEAEDDDHDPDCLECSEINEAGWWLSWGQKEGDAGAFPVMVWRA